MSLGQKPHESGGRWHDLRELVGFKDHVDRVKIEQHLGDIAEVPIVGGAAQKVTFHLEQPLDSIAEPIAFLLGELAHQPIDHPLLSIVDPIALSHPRTVVALRRPGFG